MVTCARAFRAFHQSIPMSDREVERWDKEWLLYLMNHKTRPYLLAHTQCPLDPEVLEKLPQLSENDMMETVFSPPLDSASIWVKGTDIIDKRVMEIGCGTGLMGKQLEKIAQHYLGIDYSLLALHMARLVSPDKCHYVHLADVDALVPYLNSMDTMVCRHFFIHQNFDNARWLLQLAHYLLKDGGVIGADFFYSNQNPFPPGIFPAKHPLSDFPSNGFVFTQEESEELARDCGYSIEKIKASPKYQRGFVRFVKTPTG